MITRAGMNRLMKRIEQLEKHAEVERTRRKANGKRRDQLLTFLLDQETDRSTFGVLRTYVQEMLCRASGTLPMPILLPEKIGEAYVIRANTIMLDQDGSVYRINPDKSLGKFMTKVFVGHME